MSTREVLAEVRSVSNRVLNYASIHGFAAVKPPEVCSGVIADDADRKPAVARSALNDNAPVRAIETAIGVTAALDILRLPSVTQAGIRARWLTQGQNADTGPAELRSCARDGPISAAVAIEARRHDMGPELQLRYRAAITMPCAPDLDLPRVRDIAASVPTALWPEWSDRLLLDIRPTIAMRTALSCATLLCGSTVKPVAAARLLGEVITPNALNQRLWVLRSSAYWESICAALIRLSDYLDEFGAPVDYRRRRQLDYSTLLPTDLWQQVREAISDASRVPVSADLETLLDVRAQRFLEQQGIVEPVAWHAPLDLLTDLGLPEPR